ncbi:peptidase [Paracoccus salipaludis]|uniref:Peptidase n=1 Tax=Paracoccus salipaludis TaxID=2032623 RepID=A0A2A2GNI3_9RHOB|nr:peptidase [Paracoccus salipaludis]PAU98292.1 peptidase [Paracoccus salipaludis]
MTYCVGFLVRAGLVMMADTRTNAGVDNVSTYRKLRLHGNDGTRLIVTASAGSLSTTQDAVQRLQQGVPNPETGALDSFETVTSIYDAALAAGRAIRAARDGMDSLQQGQISFDATLLVGGSVGGEPLRLFLVYPAGNCIECGPDTPYLQIGENKYGKPILDRALDYDTDLYDAVKIGLISFSSTMRSNLAVGLPIDLVTARQGQSEAEVVRRIETNDGYFAELSRRWSEVINEACRAVPKVPFEPAG